MTNRARIDDQVWLDLREIAEFIGEFSRSSQSVIDLIDQFVEKTEIYARQPDMGDLRDDLGEGVRSFRFRRWYVAIYRPLPDGIDVLRVFDARSEYHRHLGE